MSDKKEQMQADGTQGARRSVAKENAPPSSGKPEMQDNEGQSGGGAYPNPHTDGDEAETQNTFMGHGGQSNMRYNSDGKRGPEKAGARDNAVTEDED